MTINLLSFKVLLCKLMVNLSGLRISSDWRSVFSLAGCCFAGCCRVVIHQFFCCYPPVGSCFYSLSPVVILQDIFETHLFGCCVSQPFSVYSGNPQDSSTLGFPGVINLRILPKKKAGMVWVGDPHFYRSKFKVIFESICQAVLCLFEELEADGAGRTLDLSPCGASSKQRDVWTMPVNQSTNQKNSARWKNGWTCTPRKGLLRQRRGSDYRIEGERLTGGLLTGY